MNHFHSLTQGVIVMFKLFQLATLVRFCIWLALRFCMEIPNVDHFFQLGKNPRLALKVLIRFKIKITQKTWLKLFDFLYIKYLKYLYSRGLHSEKEWVYSVVKWLIALCLGFFAVFEILLELYIVFYIMICFIGFVWGLISFFIGLIRWSLHPFG
uniref:Uncharacterized protein n=1 Tax=Corydalis conspersa TaxID=2182691 RepID=A0A6G8J3K2_9MAGN|nr:hypothetical protein [Corydalis conspersa]QIM61595.1 hypothetical protein [Corydalis conspersa]